MRLVIRAFVLGLLVLCPRLEAQTPEGDASLSPYFLVNSSDPTTDHLPLKSTRAQVDIAGVIADVKVTQVYRNEGSRPLEAIYVFPGSTRAAVYGMTMTIGERVLKALIKEKQQARADYEQAKQQGRSASLLEQQRPNVFQMNVANILPGDEIRVEMSYTELLVPTEGTYSFVYPTVVGPRYSGVPGTASSTGEQWVANPYTKEKELPFASFDLEARLEAGMPIDKIGCDTHKTDITYEHAGLARVKLQASEKQGGNRDFILKYRLMGGQIQSGLLLNKGDKENYFLLMMQPPKRVVPAMMPPREYVFILDVSGSMNGYPIETAKQVVSKLVLGLRPQDRFNILVFEGGSAAWSEQGSKPATPENVQEALAFISPRYGSGGTELQAALKHALDLPRTKGMSHTFVIATDGYISADYRVLDFLREHLGDANMFAFGIGTSVNRFLIEGMAHAGQGESFVVSDGRQAEAQAERFRKYIESPVLTNVKVQFDGFDAYDVEPLQVPDVLAERPVLVFGKWRGEAKGSIRVTGLSGDRAYEQTFPVQLGQPGDNGALRYLWARTRIQRMGDYGKCGSDRSAEITKLGLEYNLLTDFTSFIAVDSVVRNTTGDVQTVKQPLPLPQGVSNLAVGGSAPSNSNASMYRAQTSTSRSSGSTSCASLEAVDAGVSDAAKVDRIAALGLKIQVDAVEGDAAKVPLGDLKVAMEQALAPLVEAQRKAGKVALGSWSLVLRFDAAGKISDIRLDRGPQDMLEALRNLLLGWQLPSAEKSGVRSVTFLVKVA